MAKKKDTGTKPVTVDLDDVPEMGAESKQIDEHDSEVVRPTPDQIKMIDEVTEVGQKEFKPVHEKLTTIFDRIRPKVQILKNDVWKVRRGMPAIQVLVNDKPMTWDDFCRYAFGLGQTGKEGSASRRVNQLLEIDDKSTENLAPPIPKIHLTRPEYDARIEAAKNLGYEEGVEAGAAGHDDEEEEPEVVTKMKDTLKATKLPHDDPYKYFEGFIEEKETMATELAAMLVTFKLDAESIEQILRLAAKEAKRTIKAMCAKA
jgi:hypothetical protein